MKASIKKDIDYKAILKRKGYSVKGWARANGFSRTTTDRALAGFHNGKISKEIRHKVVLLDAE